MYFFLDFEIGQRFDIMSFESGIWKEIGVEVQIIFRKGSDINYHFWFQNFIVKMST